MALRDPRTKSAVHGHARNPDPSDSRSWGDATSQAVHTFQQTAKTMLIPAIAERTRNAISVDGRQVFLYQRLRSGRRCMCWTGANTSPNSDCPICLNTGFAGGYYKWGTDHYMFDPSRSWFGVNTLVNPLLGTPPWFSLEEGVTSGYVEWHEYMTKGTYFGLDASRFEYRRNGGQVEFKFKLEGSDLAFIPYTEAALKQRILVANGGKFTFRVYLKRAVASDPSPMFLYFMFRLLTMSAEQPILIVDIPRRNESNLLAEHGILETLNQIQMAFSDTVKRVNLDDAVIRLFDMTRWKVIESSPNDPLNMLTSHDVQLVKVYDDEGIARIIM